MQKIINIFFIVAMLLLATALPLNTAILDFRLFGTHEIGNNDVPVTETITFSEATATLKSGEVVRYLPDSDIPFAKLILGISSPRNLEKLVLRFHSNTGKFEAPIPSTTITYQSVTDKTQTDKKNVTTTDLVPSIDPAYKEYEIDLASYYSGIASGSHGFLAIHVADQLVARVDAVKFQAMKPLMKYITELPAGSKAVKLYLPDEKYEILVPVHRFEPAQMVNYIGLYEALRAGAKPGFGLYGKDAVAMSSDYWIENNAARIEYRSGVLKNYKNPELMYEAVARTFGSYGTLKQTVVNVDRVQAAVIDTSEKITFYYPVQGSTHTWVMEDKRPTAAKTAETQATTTVDAAAFTKFFQDYLDLLSDVGYLPAGLYRPNHTLEQVTEGNQSKLEFRLTFENNDDLPLPEHFEVFLSLTLYRYPGIDRVILNGTELPRIKAFNIEE